MKGLAKGLAVTASLAVFAAFLITAVRSFRSLTRTKGLSHHCLAY